MGAILGIDAAWTHNHPSGVALVNQAATGEWECLEVASAYGEFLEQCGTVPERNRPEIIPIRSLLEASKFRAGIEVVLVAADIPLSKREITGRRPADDKVSAAFGRMDCGTHSPSSARPGRVSEQMRDGFKKCGFRLATGHQGISSPALIEVYPHPALLGLMGCDRRFEYKAGKTKKYWPELPLQDRKDRLRRQYGNIVEALGKCIRGIPSDLVAPESRLKAIEDRIDALICAWVGILALNGEARPMGDQEAAIWIPECSMLRTWVKLLNSESASEEYMNGVEDLPVQERTFFGN